MNEHTEVDERCGGCRQSDSNLTPISDGSMKVCSTCYPNATSMFLTEGADRQVQQSPSSCAEPVIVAAVRKSSKSRLGHWHSSFNSFYKIIVELKCGPRRPV